MRAYPRRACFLGKTRGPHGGPYANSGRVSEQRQPPRSTATTAAAAATAATAVAAAAATARTGHRDEKTLAFSRTRDPTTRYLAAAARKSARPVHTTFSGPPG
ncbi:hypothetical protein PUN28_011358 [Cardiocondyla obscurior]|uniref:Secreted protein n=1 Tax=Cardiocondyla obscurior TaxID=286306 RepID=A0AAW2FDH9_9HYME